MNKKHLNVVAAVIMQDNEVYCFKKGKSKYEYLSRKFEFPGGKINEGESKADALIREIKEELDVNITIKNELIEYDYEYPDFSLTMTSFLCKADSTDFQLGEHVLVLKKKVSELRELEWLPADLPVLSLLEVYKNGEF